MARTRHDEPDEDEEPDEDWEGDEYEDEEDDYDPDDPETYPHGVYADPEPVLTECPHCGAEILDDSERCPRCEAYLSREDAPQARSGPWVVLMVLALLAAALLVLVG